MIPQRITAWSFSRWNVYQECPAKAKYKFIDKFAEPGSAAMDRGTAIHLLCEKYLRGIDKTLHKDIKQIGDILKDLKKRGAIPEANFTFKQDWTPTRWDDWKGAWCRMKADVTIPPIINGDNQVGIDDFKTGGKKKLESGDFEEYFTQLELYDIAGLVQYPTADSVKSRLIFVDFNKVVEAPKITFRKDLPKLQKKWELRVKKMLSDTVFKPTPGNGCTFCHFKKANDGPCKF